MSIITHHTHLHRVVQDKFEFLEGKYLGELFEGGEKTAHWM